MDPNQKVWRTELRPSNDGSVVVIRQWRSPNGMLWYNEGSYKTRDIYSRPGSVKHMGKWLDNWLGWLRQTRPDAAPLDIAS